MGVECDRWVRHQDPRHGLRVGFGNALSLVQGRKLFAFTLGIFADFVAFDVDFMLDEFILGSYRDELSGGHRECAGEQTSDACETDSPRSRVRTGDTQDQRYVGEESIAGAEHRGTPRIALHVPMPTRRAPTSFEQWRDPA